VGRRLGRTFSEQRLPRPPDPYQKTCGLGLATAMLASPPNDLRMTCGAAARSPDLAQPPQGGLTPKKTYGRAPSASMRLLGGTWWEAPTGGPGGPTGPPWGPARRPWETFALRSPAGGRAAGPDLQRASVSPWHPTRTTIAVSRMATCDARLSP